MLAILMKFSKTIQTCPRKILYRFDPRPHHPGPGVLETLKAERHIFKMFSRLQINPGSAGYLSIHNFDLFLQSREKMF